MIRYLLSPGPVPISETINIEFSHRSEKFAQIYVDTIKQLKAITGGREAVLIQGSASAAIESVINGVGLAYRNDVWVLENGSFAKRVLDRLNETKSSPAFNTPLVRRFTDVQQLLEGVRDLYYQPYAIYAVQFETSTSKYNDMTELAKICKERNIRLIVDAVSAFPYYPLPDADVIILSSSKQLRGLPVLGIVSYRDNNRWFYDGPEYLNLNRAINKAATGQTLHTSMMPQVMSLWRSLYTRDYKSYVDAIVDNCNALVTGLEKYVVGDAIAPVITFKCLSSLLPSVVDELDKKGFDVYWNKSYMTSTFQVSCFNYNNHYPYFELNAAIKKLIEKGWM